MTMKITATENKRKMLFHKKCFLQFEKKIRFVRQQKCMKISRCVCQGHETDKAKVGTRLTMPH